MSANNIPFRHLSASADLRLWGDGTATLSSLYAKEPQKGHGRALMGRIAAFADEHNLVIILKAQRFLNPRGMTNDQLVSFYEKFGFEAVGIFGGLTLMKRPVGGKPQELHVL